MQIGRYAWQSGSGETRHQSFEIWQGRQLGPVPLQGMASTPVADSSIHLWRVAMPEDLPEGARIAEVTARMADGREYSERITFEVRAERPLQVWDNSLWQDTSN